MDSFYYNGAAFLIVFFIKIYPPKNTIKNTPKIRVSSAIKNTPKQGGIFWGIFYYLVNITKSRIMIFTCNYVFLWGYFKLTWQKFLNVIGKGVSSTHPRKYKKTNFILNFTWNHPISYHYLSTYLLLSNYMKYKNTRILNTGNNTDVRFVRIYIICRYDN